MSERSEHPFPKAPGGLQGATFGRPMRTTGTLRQPDLGQPPNVVSVTGGLSGAFIINEGNDADRSQGLVAINVGLTPAASGTVVLRFPAGVAANQYVALADWATFTQAVAGSQLTLTWTATRTLIPNERLLIAYQWATST